MKWQTIALWLTGLILIGGTVTYVDLFSGLFELTGISYTHSGDIVCGETCESYINVTTTYWRICFAGYENTKYENETLFKKRSRSRTLHVNMDNIDSIISTEPRVEVDWLVPTYGKKWRPIKDGDCWDRLKTNKIKLVGHKESSQTVKWNFKAGYVEIDPKWVGIKEKKLIKTEYTYNTKLEEYSDNTGNAIIYSGMRYADSTGTKIEEASSLKTCEFCDNIPLIINSDGTHLVNVFDYNYTSLTAEFYYNESNLGEYEHEIEEGKMKTKLKIITIKYDKVTGEPYEEEIEYEVEIEEGEKLEQTIPFGFDKVIKWGENSTEIIINATAAKTGWVRDDSGCTGTGFATFSGSHVVDVGTSSAGSGWIYKTYIEFDTSPLTDNVVIDSASVNSYINVNNVAAGNAIVYQINYTNFDTNLFVVDIGPSEGIIFTTSAVNNYYNVSVSSVHINKTGLTHYTIQSDFACADASDQWFNSDTTKPHYMNITYSVADTCSPSSPLSADHTFDCADDCTQSTELDAGGNNIYITGTGSFTATANIINYADMLIKGTSESDRCFVTTIDGGGFRT